MSTEEAGKIHSWLEKEKESLFVKSAHNPPTLSIPIDKLHTSLRSHLAHIPHMGIQNQKQPIIGQIAKGTHLMRLAFFRAAQGSQEHKKMQQQVDSYEKRQAVANRTLQEESKAPPGGVKPRLFIVLSLIPKPPEDEQWAEQLLSKENRLFQMEKVVKFLN